MLSLICFKQPSVHPQEDLFLQLYGIFYIHPSKQSDRCRNVFDAVSNIPTSTRLLIRMNENNYYKTACTNLPEDEHLFVRNMSNTIQLN